MDRTQLIIGLAAILFLAFALGWLAAVIVARLRHVSSDDMSEIDRLAQELHEAERIRDEAIAYIEAREQELINQLNQTNAELQAAMEALGDCRRENDELKGWIEQNASG